MIGLRHGRRRGFTLLELIVVMVGLSFCMAIGTVLIVTLLRTDGLGRTAANRIDGRTALSGQFRRDVASAKSMPARDRDFTASPTCLILEMPDQARVVYLWHDDKLERIERRDKNETRRPEPAAAGKVEFVRSESKIPVITMRITDPAGASPGKQTDVSAALGGDLR